MLFGVWKEMSQTSSGGVTPLPAEANEPVHTIPVLVASTGTIHYAIWYDSYEHSKKGYYWPSCGQHTSNMQQDTLDERDVHQTDRFCRTCLKIFDLKENAYEGCSYGELFEMLRLNLVIRLSRNYPQVRLKEFEIWYDRPHSKTAVRWRGKTVEVSQQFINRSVKRIQEMFTAEALDRAREGVLTIEISAQGIPNINLTKNQVRDDDDETIRRRILTKILGYWICREFQKDEQRILA